MSIPLYLAVNCKDSVSKDVNYPFALTGYGIAQDGSVRSPACTMQQAHEIIVVDDAVIPDIVPEGTALDALASFCGDRGCFFDFIRPVCEFHTAVIAGLRRRLSRDALLLVPEAYLSFAPDALCVVSCPEPCNHWESFVRKAEQKYRTKWCLEVTPWDAMFELHGVTAKEQRGSVPQAMCHYECTQYAWRYFDTSDTLRRKLLSAQKHGCQAAIGLYDELSDLFL